MSNDRTRPGSPHGQGFLLSVGFLLAACAVVGCWGIRCGAWEYAVGAVVFAVFGIFAADAAIMSSGEAEPGEPRPLWTPTRGAEATIRHLLAANMMQGRRIATLMTALELVVLHSTDPEAVNVAKAALSATTKEHAG